MLKLAKGDFYNFLNKFIDRMKPNTYSTFIYKDVRFVAVKTESQIENLIMKHLETPINTESAYEEFLR